MRTMTLLRAYQRARDHMGGLRHARGFSRGIAVHDDYYALLWQRRRRQAERFYNALAERIEALEDANGHTTKERFEL